MSDAEDTRFVTPDTIDKMSVRYGEDVIPGFETALSRLTSTALPGAFGWFAAGDAERMYDTVREHCRTSLTDGTDAGGMISELLVQCARNWRAAERANLVDHRPAE
ncbi:hypothetical protein GCM10022224_010040 [Nonomuraea antimicrobica]|uniref:Excreted virulence factor EspC, type VII ESX diderm n=1 Tax=Nonomuraea antimicrobica TaxID=561173 RepID=A0ABP7B5X9_9ACTN